MNSKKQLRKERPKPELMTVGNRQISSNGHWNNTLMADYIMLHGQSRWIPMGALGKVAWGQNTPTTKQRARKNLSRLWAYILLNHGRLMVTAYAPPYNSAQAVKMYDATSQQERQALQHKLSKMFNRQELSAERYELALALLQRPPIPMSSPPAELS